MSERRHDPGARRLALASPERSELASSESDEVDGARLGVRLLFRPLWFLLPPSRVSSSASSTPSSIPHTELVEFGTFASFVVWRTTTRRRHPGALGHACAPDGMRARARTVAGLWRAMRGEGGPRAGRPFDHRHCDRAVALWQRVGRPRAIETKRNFYECFGHAWVNLSGAYAMIRRSRHGRARGPGCACAWSVLVRAALRQPVAVVPLWSLCLVGALLSLSVTGRASEGRR